MAVGTPSDKTRWWRHALIALLVGSCVLIASRRYDPPPPPPAGQLTSPPLDTAVVETTSTPQRSPPSATRRVPKVLTNAPRPPVRQCPIPPLFVITDQTVCPFVLNLCESLVKLGLPVAPLLKAPPASVCAALLRATSHLFEQDLKTKPDLNASAVADSDIVRRHAVEIGLGGCLFVTYSPKLASRADYPRLLMSKASSWIRWYDAVKAAMRPPPAYIAISDVDVELFPGAVELLSPFVDAPAAKPDMVLQRDLDEKNPKNKNGNAGFFLLRTDNAAVERAMRWMANTSAHLLASLTRAEIKEKYPGGDQHLLYDVVREARTTYGFTWRTFPRKLVNDGRAAAYWATTAVHHPHMSGKYKPTNMRRLIAFKQGRHGNESVTSGECLPVESGMTSSCDAAEQCSRIPM